MKLQKLDNTLIILQLRYDNIYFNGIILTYFLIRLRLYHETLLNNLIIENTISNS